MEEASMVDRYMDVFLEEIPGSPSNRETDRTIDLVRGTAPMSKIPIESINERVGNTIIRITRKMSH